MSSFPSVTPVDFAELKLDVGQERVLIFSDSHLTPHFEPAKYDFLQSIIKQADRVVINGDFWDVAAADFSDFLKSNWRRLFPLLKEKRTIYLYGNHDLRGYCDQGVKLFSEQQANAIWLKSGQRELLIRHGCHLAASLDISQPHIFSNPPMFKIGNFLTQLNIRLLPKWYFRRFSRYNQQMKKFASNLNENQLLVCGHSHFQEQDVSCHFINTGWIRYGYGQYLLVEEGKLQLLNQDYC